MKYKIGDRVYMQRPLVFGQVRQIIPLFQGMALPNTSDMASLAGCIGDKLPQVLAVILTEEGKDIREKDIDETASFLEFEITAEQTIQVIEDFFACNPAASLLERLTGIMNLMGKMTGSKPQSSPLPGAILPNETQSCGDMHREM